MNLKTKTLAFIKRKEIYFILVLASFVLFCSGLSEITTSQSDETYYFSSGLNMVKSGDWITPVFEGQEVRFQKPIIFYWLVALSFKNFGVNIFSGRLPSVIFAAAGIVLIYYFSLILFGNPKGALFSSLALLSSPLYFLNARAARTDMVLTFFITLSLLFFAKGFFGQKKRRLYFVFSFIAMGLATMTKGPPGFLIPLISIVVLLSVFPKNRPVLKDIFSPWPFIFFLLIVVPWPLVMYLLHGGRFINSFFFSELVNRVDRYSIDLVSNIGYYLATVVRHFFPWSIFLLIGILSTRKKENNRNEITFLFLWLAVTFGMFTFFVSSGHSRYLLPLSPALALLSGEYLVRIDEQGAFQNRLFKLMVLFVLSLFILLGLVLLFLTVAIHSFGYYGFIFSLLALIVILGGSILLGRFYKRKIFVPIPPTIACTMVTIAFIFIGGIIPAATPDPWKDLSLKYLKGVSTEDKVITLGLGRGPRVWLTIYTSRFLDGIYYGDQIGLAYDYLEGEKASPKTLFVILPDSEYVRLPENLRRDYPIKGSSFTYDMKGEENTKEIFRAIREGRLKSFLDEHRKYFYVLTNRNNL
jgi:4-amino-4-deoxy-L-arabinose transferase-like glycosyltransferase